MLRIEFGSGELPVGGTRLEFMMGYKSTFGDRSHSQNPQH
jgi:hypothetical protein